MARLKKAPVCFTLAQMRFNPVLDVSEILPSLQDAFRKSGYPDYQSSTAHNIEIRQGGAGAGFQLNPVPVVQHVFRNKGQTAAIVLDAAAMSYELTDYPDSEEFSANFLQALDIVHAHRSIEYCDRLGMRMLDAVQPMNNEALDKYVTPQALGLIGLIDSAFEHQQSSIESLFKRGSYTLMVRALRVPKGVSVPADLGTLRLKIDQRFLDHQGETIMLDCDSSRSERVDFDLGSTFDDLARLNADLSNCFKALVTPYAFKVWE